MNNLLQKFMGYMSANKAVLIERGIMIVGAVVGAVVAGIVANAVDTSTPYSDQPAASEPPAEVA